MAGCPGQVGIQVCRKGRGGGRLAALMAAVRQARPQHYGLSQEWCSLDGNGRHPLALPLSFVLPFFLSFFLSFFFLSFFLSHSPSASLCHTFTLGQVYIKTLSHTHTERWQEQRGRHARVCLCAYAYGDFIYLFPLSLTGSTQ